MSRPTPPRRLADFGDLFLPDQADEPILGPNVRAALMEWLTEIWFEKKLQAVGINARRRAIFHGPPGCGKTTLAHHLAARLGLPMLAVRPDKMTSSYYGGASQNIGALFEAARAELNDAPIVLFIDEFDAIGGSRREAAQAVDNDRNEAVNTLLQRLEQHQGFLIAATNFADWIDQAVWRRFDMHVEGELPGQGERERILARYLAPFGLPDRQMMRLAEACGGASPALLKTLAENLKRQMIIGPELGSDMRCEATFDRVLVSVQPHPSLGQPRLWSLGHADPALKGLTWPLPKADALPAEEPEPTAGAGNVVPMGRG